MFCTIREDSENRQRHLVVFGNGHDRVLSRFRHLIVSATPQQAAGQVFSNATPLFEKEWHLLFAAGAEDFPDPLNTHRSRMRTGFAADNDPVNSAQINISQ